MATTAPKISYPLRSTRANRHVVRVGTRSGTLAGVATVVLILASCGDAADVADGVDAAPTTEARCEARSEDSSRPPDSTPVSVVTVEMSVSMGMTVEDAVDAGAIAPGQVGCGFRPASAVVDIAELDPTWVARADLQAGQLLLMDQFGPPEEQG